MDNPPASAMTELPVWAQIAQWGILLAGGGTVGAFISGYFGRQKTTAEAEATLSRATLDFAESLRHDIHSLRTRLDSSEEGHEKTKKELDITREKLDQAEDKARQLEDIVKATKERDEKNTALLKMLAEALSKYDPKNPVLDSLKDQM